MYVEDANGIPVVQKLNIIVISVVGELSMDGLFKDMEFELKETGVGFFDGTKIKIQTPGIGFVDADGEYNALPIKVKLNNNGLRLMIRNMRYGATLVSCSCRRRAFTTYSSRCMVA